MKSQPVKTSDGSVRLFTKKQGWRLGEWQIYDEGEVHQTIKKIVSILLAQKYEITVRIASESHKLNTGRRLFEILRDFEKSRGPLVVLNVLADGIRIQCLKEGHQIDIRTNMRVPSESHEQKELFFDMITSWMEHNPLCFVERFFRLPKITEDPADYFLDNNLEKSLKRIFGFDFKYKVAVRCDKTTPQLEALRATIYKILR